MLTTQWRWLRILLGVLPLLGAGSPQNPSPMVEHTREHPRLAEPEPPGRRVSLEIGRLFVPEGLAGRQTLPLLVHFHGGLLVPELAAAHHGKTAVLAAQLGSGSETYAKPFRDPKAFGRLLEEAESKAGVRFESVGLSGWSAGYGAIGEILKVAPYYDRVRFVILIDGLHTGYVGGKPGPLESSLEPEPLAIFVKYAKDAVARRKQMIVTHSEIFPGTFASTTETTDYLLGQLGLRRTAVLKWGPMKTQQLSEVRQGGFVLVGYAGNSAPDHVDQLHSLPDYLDWIQP